MSASDNQIVNIVFKNETTSFRFLFLQLKSRLLAEWLRYRKNERPAQGVLVARSSLAKQQLLRPTKWLGKVALGSMLRHIAFAQRREWGGQHPAPSCSVHYELWEQPLLQGCVPLKGRCHILITYVSLKYPSVTGLVANSSQVNAPSAPI